MRFEWDENKNKSNFEKHGIRFEEACLIFNGPILSRKDDRSDYGEERIISVGELEGVVILTVVHTPRGGKTRIISARKASGKERKFYYEYITKKA